MSEERFIDRLEAFMKAEGLNANKVTVAAELSNGLLGKALKTRGSMNSDSVERILCAYTNLSEKKPTPPYRANYRTVTDKPLLQIRNASL